jgi:hypothetical protein
MLVMMRLVAPDGHEPNPSSWELVAAACGLAGHDALLAEHDAARHSIAALWASIRDQRDDRAE